MMALYLTFGLGFYIGLAVNNPDSFRNASVMSIVRGLVLALLLWPLALILLPFVKDRLG